MRESPDSGGSGGGGGCSVKGALAAATYSVSDHQIHHNSINMHLKREAFVSFLFLWI